MKKCLLGLMFFLISINVYASGNGCCSHHDGVDCSSVQTNGHVVCNDGWTDSTCYYNDIEKCSASYNEDTKELEEDNNNILPTVLLTGAAATYVGYVIKKEL